MTSIVVARNTLFPESMTEGNAAGGRKLVLFTSAHGHYSIEKAAQACGFGSKAVVCVPVDPETGAMSAPGLEASILRVKADGGTPFYINATAGTTVLGSFDPFVEISKVASRHRCWFHVDASWGGSFVFSESLRNKLKGVHLADSVAMNPHKMLGVPLTCSFLLARDLKTFREANKSKAGYLFHTDGDVEEEDDDDDDDDWVGPMDLADLTLQCGRRGDSLKMFLAWQYYGNKGYGEKIDKAYAVTRHFAELIIKEQDLVLVSEQIPPCLQVCFYFAPGGKLFFGEEEGQLKPTLRSESKGVHLATEIAKMNGKVTAAIAEALVARGFMVDFAPALEGQPQIGKFLRCVVNSQTIPETTERLVQDVVELGRQVVSRMRKEHESPITNGHVHLTSGAGDTMREVASYRGHGPIVGERLVTDRHAKVINAPSCVILALDLAERSDV